MRFGMVGQTGPWMRQVVGFGIGPRDGVVFGVNWGHSIVTSGEFAALLGKSCVNRRGLFPNYFVPSCSNLLIVTSC